MVEADDRARVGRGARAPGALDRLSAGQWTLPARAWTRGGAVPGGGRVPIRGERVEAAPGASFADVGGGALTAEAFFAKAAGRRVKATGTSSGGALLATRFEIES